MPSFPVPLEDGDYAMFSTVVDDWTTSACSRDEVLGFMILDGFEHAIRSARAALTRADAHPERARAHTTGQPPTEVEVVAENDADDDGSRDYPQALLDAIDTIVAWHDEEEARREAYWAKRRAEHITQAQRAESIERASEADNCLGLKEASS